MRLITIKYPAIVLNLFFLPAVVYASLILVPAGSEFTTRVCDQQVNGEIIEASCRDNAVVRSSGNNDGSVIDNEGNTYLRICEPTSDPNESSGGLVMAPVDCTYVKVSAPNVPPVADISRVSDEENRGLVPCGGPGQEACQACHAVSLMSNVINWLIVILGFLAGLVIIYAGIRLVTSSGNASAMEKAKSILSNMLIGYVIVLAAWLLIDYGIKMLVDEAEFGPWNVISCVEQETIEQKNVNFIRLENITASGLNRTVFTPADVNAAVATITTSGDVRTMVEEAARQAGLSAEQTRIFVALIHQESSMCRNMISSANALGCGQLLLPTAQGLDPSATRQRLLNDNAYNLTLSARYFSQQLRSFGNTRLALAAYNGGPGANAASRDCPGLRRWECEWDSPGCYNTGNTTCTRNTGYNETRNYVRNIMTTAPRL